MSEQTITQKLCEIQSTLSAPKNQYNKFGKYNYRSCEDILSAVKPKLAGAGLVLTLDDELIILGDRYYVRATASLMDGNDGIAVHAYARETEEKKGMDQSQVTGTASSYARKYALNGLFLIDDVKDDDTSEPSDTPILSARDVLTDACRSYADFTGSTSQEVMNSVAAREDFEKSDKYYLRVADELRSQIQ